MFKYHSGVLSKTNLNTTPNPAALEKLAAAYKSLGFTLERETDDHQVYWKEGIDMMRPIILKKDKSVGRDIIHNNMRTGKISRAEMLKYL